MANNTKTKKSTTQTKVAVETVEKEVQSESIKKTAESKKYEATDMIPCSSLFQGDLSMIGRKTGNVYRWYQSEDVTDVEYQDLKAEIGFSNSRYIYDPLIIIEDDEIVSQNKKVQALYNSMYSAKDLRAVLALQPTAMKSTIEKLPKGARDNIKVLAATCIQNGTLDSIKKISILDEIFGTELLTQIQLFS